MYSILSSVLSSIFRLLWNTVRNQTGALTEEKCRKIIVQDLDNIKSKLDGLVRKDLLSSFSFLKEGICRLKTSLDKPIANDEEITWRTEYEHGESTAFTRDNPTKTHSCESEQVGASLQEIFNETRSLSTMLKASKEVSNERYLSAKESFKEARKEATRAFSNGALDTKDRILATKLRIISAILENLEDADAAMSDCVMYMEALHSIPAIQQAFLRYCNCSPKCCHGTNEIDENKRKDILANTRSIRKIHVVMYAFAKEFTRNPPEFLLKWPTVNVEAKSIHLVYETNDTLAISYQMPTKDMPAMEASIPVNAMRLNTFCSAVNSKGDIIAMSWDDNEVKLIKPTGEMKVFCSLPLEICLPMHSLAIDNEDYVYILTWNKKQDDEKNNYEILVFSADGNLRRQHPFEFLRETKNSSFTICVNDRKEVFIHCQGDDQLYVYDTTASEVSMFSLEQKFNAPLCLCPVKKDLLLVAPKFQDIVYVYTVAGKIALKFQIPHEIHGVEYRRITMKIIIYACVYPKCSYKLLTYSLSQKGKLMQISPPLPDEWDEFGRLTSHPNGLLALVHNKGVVYI